VLNRHPNEAISEKVKQRVWQAARALDYHPSAAAAGLARKRTRNVAIIFYKDERAISNQFYSFVIQGAVKETTRQQYNLLFSYVDTTYQGYQDLPKVIQERNAEGALFMRQIHPKMIRDIQRRGIPVVTIDHYPAMKQVNTLQIDNRRGGQLAAQHLIELGHSRVGILLAATNRPSISERAEGFRAAFAQSGLGRSARVTSHHCESFTFAGGYQESLRVLKQKRTLTALFSANDEMAAGALRAARELGRRVPEDLSVVGFDDITMSNYTDPPLTTVGVVKEQLGQRAMQRLLELVETRNGALERETVPVELIVRKSTARPAAQAKPRRRR
jgi:LacI family transcriptional regulator